MIRTARVLSGLLFAFFAGGGVVATLPSAPAAACTSTFLTLPPWYDGLSKDCKNIDTSIGPEKFIPILVSNIVEIILQLVGYVAVLFIIYGGFLYMTSTGEPQKLAGAKSTILNAIIGLIVAIFAVTIVNFISARLQ